MNPYPCTTKLMLRTILLFTVILSFSMTSCKNDIECNSSIPVESSFQLLNGAYLRNFENDKQVQYFIIDSQSEFIEVIGDSAEMPDIDYSTSFLLAVRYNLPHCGVATGAEIVQECDRLTYNLEISDELCQKPTDVYAFSIVSNEFKSLPLSIKRKSESL